MDYWLFTFNYLRPFKGYFKTKEEALEKLNEIIQDADKYYKRVLKEEYLEEKKYREKFTAIKEAFKAKDRYENFTGVTEEQLEVSIKLLNLSDEPSPTKMTSIFTTQTYE